MEIIDNFFRKQNLTLPDGERWRTLSTNVFEVVDGKRILFRDSYSLFHQLRTEDKKIELKQDIIAAAMTHEEIHEDVERFFGKLKGIIKP